MTKKLLYVSFSYDIDQNFDEQIASALHGECESITGFKINSDRVSVYLKQNNEVVAGAICYVHGKIMWCDSIYVGESNQNKGFGSQLVSRLMETATERNLSEIQLNTYFPKAVQFFKKLKFEEVAVIPNWKYGLTCYLMRKLI